MKLSIVIPVYNRARSLRACIENVLSFNYDDYELILVNDASTDGSDKVCAEYASSYENISLVNNERNLGPGLSRNAGLDKASGDYIIFLDSDDKYDTSLLRTVADALIDKKPDILVYSLWEEYYDAGGNLSYKYSHSLPTCYLSQASDIHRFVVLLEEETMLGYPWNKAYNLEYLREHDVRFTDILHVEDILFNIEAFENASSLMVLEDRLYHYCNEADNRLTDKYLPGYFELQKTRIRKFYAQQKRWGSLDSYALSVLSKEYFRWLLSAVERQVARGVGYGLAREFRSKMFAKFSKFLASGTRPLGLKLRILYAPLINRNIKGTIAIARAISVAKRQFPGLFNILKQSR